MLQPHYTNNLIPNNEAFTLELTTIQIQHNTSLYVMVTNHWGLIFISYLCDRSELEIHIQTHNFAFHHQYIIHVVFLYLKWSYYYNYRISQNRKDKNNMIKEPKLEKITGALENQNNRRICLQLICSIILIKWKELQMRWMKLLSI